MSSQDHQAVAKNGHDNKQDRAIRELHDDLIKHVVSEEGDLRAVETGVESLRATVEKYLYAGRVAWGFIGVMGALVLAYQTSLDVKVDQMQSDLHNVSVSQASFEERGTRWGNDLDTSVAELREELRQLRRLVNEHQRSKTEHSK